MEKITIVFVSIIAIIVATIGLTSYITGVSPRLDITSLLPSSSPSSTPAPSPSSVVCTQDAKQCSDGSFVSRAGPKCDFALCPGEAIVTPSPYAQCKSDADCPSKNYTCEIIQGYGTASPGNTGGGDIHIMSGECKLKQGNACGKNTDCAGGLVCNAGICANPIGQGCSGPSDTSCASGYQCIQGCGPPIARYGDKPAPYVCQLKGYPRMCPICLASNTMISTPNGEVNVKDIHEGTLVWSMNLRGEKIISKVSVVSRTIVPSTHEVVHLMLDDKREVWVSPGHPTINGTSAGELRVGSAYDGSRVIRADFIPYWDNATYDLLPNSDTSFYWANGILFASTLK